MHADEVNSSVLIYSIVSSTLLCYYTNVVSTEDTLFCLVSTTCIPLETDGHPAAACKRYMREDNW